MQGGSLFLLLFTVGVINNLIYIISNYYHKYMLYLTFEIYFFFNLLWLALEKNICQEEEELSPEDPVPAGLRIRKTQHATTLRLFVDSVTEFNLEQVDYKEKCQERIHRIASIGKPLPTSQVFGLYSFRRINKKISNNLCYYLVWKSV